MADQYSDRYHGVRPPGWPFHVTRSRLLDGLYWAAVGMLVGVVFGILAAEQIRIEPLELPTITVGAP